MTSTSEIIGIYGGTFNPFHIGHLHLALSLLEKGYVTKVIYCPTALSPFKQGQEDLIDIAHRYQMVEQSIKGIPNLEISDIESKDQTKPSFTVGTINKFKCDYPAAALRLIIGEDLVPIFNQFHEASTILKGAPPIAGARIHSSIENPCSIEIVQIPMLDISSSLIRKRAHMGLFFNHLVPCAVQSLIHKNHLYS
jgi:nicotinate-nucleotide adenylyltransferase